ncbi:WD40 repeat protein [Actinokineospora baliensis]|uniref:NACHT and WD repeat domain-containing protein n=1 Tax=Actinokineospora baliensis TaxID=547056 RepID=UPI001956B383|nr:WD40 repeat domain-containing protein [Actinokineospora baliensis]MBM7776108.1 WD40 repeat protein [Actinokineospora baliensis]
MPTAEQPGNHITGSTVHGPVVQAQQLVVELVVLSSDLAQAPQDRTRLAEWVVGLFRRDPELWSRFNQAAIAAEGDLTEPVRREFLGLLGQVGAAAAGMSAAVTEQWDRGLAELVGVGQRLGAARPAVDWGAEGPYPGLAAFTDRHAPVFFGRERTLARLLAELGKPRTQPLFVVGVSGVGKSSLLRAGLVPAIGRGELLVPGSASWPRVVFTPRGAPLTGLREALPDNRSVLVVDQFENALLEDDPERSAFLAAVADAAEDHLVVVGLRADAYAACAAVFSLHHNTFTVGRMTDQELGRAITAPAAAAGVTLADGLADLMIEDLRDLGPDPHYHPGSLPLLGYALHATWHRHRGTTMTLADYHAAGRVRGALVEAADHVLASLPEPDVRSVLVSLVTLGEEGAHRRRRVPVDLIAGPVLTELHAARLITITDDQAEISHDALLRTWPHLRTWLAEAAESAPFLDRLAKRAQTWLDLSQDPGSLDRGAQLTLTQAWLAASPTRFATLGPVERRFVTASLAADQAHTYREALRLRRLRRLNAAIAAVLVLSLAAGALAVLQWRRAGTSRGEALSRQYSAQAMASGVPADRAAMYALRAYDVARTPEARGALLGAAMSGYLGTIDGPGLTPTVMSGDGRYLAIIRDNRELLVWDVTDRTALPINFSFYQGLYLHFEFSPDGRWFAAAHPGGTAVWELPSGRQAASLPASYALAWQPDGRRLATVSPQPTHGFSLRYWRTATWEADGEVAARQAEHISFSPDGRRVALVDQFESSLTVMSTDGTPAWRRTDVPEVFLDATWSPDGAAVVTGTPHGIRFWNSSTGGLVEDVPLPQSSALRGRIAFTADGQLMANGHPSSIRFWSTRTHEWTPEVIGEAAVGGVIAADGHVVAFANEDGSVDIVGRDGGWLPLSVTGQVHVDVVDDALSVGDAANAVAFWDVRAHTHLRSQRYQGPGRVALSAAGLSARRIAPNVVRMAGDGTSTDITVDNTIISAMAFTEDGDDLGIGTSAYDTQSRFSALTLIDSTGRRLANREFDLLGSVLAVETLPGKRLAVVTKAYLPEYPATNSVLRVVRIPGLDDEFTLDLGPGPIRRLSIGGSGRIAAAIGTDRAVTIWDLDARRTKAKVGDHPLIPTAVAITADERVVATGADVVRLWDVRTGELFAVLPGHSEQITDLAWTADGKLVTAADDGRVGVWDVDVERVVARLCRAVGPRADWASIGVGPEDVPCPS